jgi:hypothetical protein
LIREHFEAENRDFFFTKDDKLAKEYKFLKDPKEIPKNGACIFLNKPNKEVILFKKTYCFSHKSVCIQETYSKPTQ